MPFSGTVAIRAMKDNDYQATIFAGTTAGLQAAIDYLAGGKGEVAVGPGTLTVTAPIRLASNLHLRGAIGTTLKWPDSYSASNNDALLSAASSVSGITIEDLVLDGNRTNVSTANAVFGIRMVDPTLVRISRVRVTESHNGGIRLLSSAASVTDCIIEDCLVDGFGTATYFSTLGITIESGTNSVTNSRNIIRNCLVRDATVAANARGIIMEANYSRVSGCSVQNLASVPNSDDVVGISLNKCTGSQVTGCSVDNIYGYAYSVQNGRIAGGDSTFVNQSNTVVGNSANVCRFGLEASGGSNLNISSNSFRGTVAIVGGGAAEGIEVNADSTGAVDLVNTTIHGNCLDGFIGNAIWVGRGSAGSGTLRSVSVCGNSISTTSKAGVVVWDYVEGMTISGNGLYACGQAANDVYCCVLLGSAAASKRNKYITVSGNTIRNEQASPYPSFGIKVEKDSEEVSVVGNYIGNCAENPILFNGAAGATIRDAIVSGNKVDFSGIDAVKLTYVTGGAVTGNLIKNAGSNAGTYSGILVDNSTGVVVSGNRCFDDNAGTTQDYGLNITGTTDNITIEGNDFSGNVTGLLTASGTPTNLHFSPRTGRGTDIASAATIAIPTDGDVFHVTGVTNITNGVTVNSWDNGRTVVLIFDGILTMSDTGTSKLLAAYITTADDTLTLSCDGTNWYEVARSAN